MSDRNGVPERASRRRGRRERLPDRLAPRAILARVVELVEHDERVAREPREQRRVRRDLLVGGDDAVHVGRKRALGCRPRRVEVQREPRGRARPLLLQMRRRSDDDEARRANPELMARRGERERRLPGPGRRDREEVALGRGDEAVEGGLLPAAELNGASHRVGSRLNDPYGPHHAEGDDTRRASRRCRASRAGRRGQRPRRPSRRAARPRALRRPP